MISLLKHYNKLTCSTTADVADSIYTKQEPVYVASAPFWWETPTDLTETVAS